MQHYTHITKIEFNPLTGEYFWAQQLTMFKWSQQVYT